jgi:hypothetical protein
MILNSRRSSWTTRRPRDMSSRSTPCPQEEGTFYSSYCLRTRRHRNRHALRRPLPLLPPTPTTATKAGVRGRERGKARTMALVAPATTAVTTTGTPWCGPPSIIPGSAPSQCSQGCILRSSSQCVHHSTPCLLHQCTTRLLAAPPSRPCRCLRRTSSMLQPLPGRPGRRMGSTVIGPLLQHHVIDSSGCHRLGHRLWCLQPTPPRMPVI